MIYGFCIAYVSLLVSQVPSCVGPEKVPLTACGYDWADHILAWELGNKIQLP